MPPARRQQPRQRRRLEVRGNGFLHNAIRWRPSGTDRDNLSEAFVPPSTLWTEPNGLGVLRSDLNLNFHLWGVPETSVIGHCFRRSLNSSCVICERTKNIESIFRFLKSPPMWVLAPSSFLLLSKKNYTSKSLW